MTAERAGGQVGECPFCEASNPLDGSGDRYAECRGCGRFVYLTEPKRRWPGLLLLAGVSAPWAAAVLPSIGRDGSAEANLVATAVAWLVVRHFRRSWEGTERSVKLLKSGSRIFGIMLLFSAVFAALSILLRLLGPTAIANTAIAGILEMQARLAEWQLASIVASAGKWLLYGAAALALALLVLNRPQDLARVERGRKSAAKLLSLAALVLICFGSFSIVAATSGGTTVRLADDQVATELRKAQEALARLEAEARIVVGEQLAAAILARAPGSDEKAPAESLADDALRREQEARELAADPFPLDDVEGNAPSSAELARIVAAYQKAARPGPPAPPPPDLGRYARARPADINRALGEIGNRVRPSARSWAAPGLRDAVSIVVDLAMDGAGIRIPSAGVPKPLGAFFRKVVDTVTSKPANEAIRDRVADVALKYAGGERSPAVGDLAGLARPTRRSLRGVENHYRGRLQVAEARIASLTAPPVPAPVAVDTPIAATAAEAAPVSMPAETGSSRPDPNGACKCRWVRRGVAGPWFPCSC